MKLYHFTTHNSYECIKRDGFIRPSNNGKYGPGVYLTDLDPQITAAEEIAKLLCSIGAQKNLSAGKLDCHFYLEIPESDVRRERSHVCLYVTGAQLHTPRYEIISHGRNDKTLVVGAAGLLMAATAIPALSAAALALSDAASALHTHATNGRQERTHELETTLQTCLCAIGKKEKFISVTSGDGVSVQVFCAECNVPVSDVYEGGHLCSSHVDEKQLHKTLLKHERLHLTQKLGTALMKVTLFTAPILWVLYWW